VRVYLDEDSSSTRLVNALREAGVDVLSAPGAGNSGATDAFQLEFAARENRVIFTANEGDFARLFAEWARAGIAHAGIIVCPRQGLPPEWQANEIVRICSPADMADAIAYVRAPDVS
jgi:Domain of unknown function (DUF5615)